MQARIRYARAEIAVEIEPDQRFRHYRGPAPVEDIGAAVRLALDTPFSFPPLARCLAPGDRVAVVVDGSLAGLGEILGPILERLEDFTLVSATPGPHGWAGGRAVEEHDPQKVAYLASTGGGRRVYMNRTVVEADQVIVVSARRFEGGGVGGAEAALYPALGDGEAAGAGAEESREAAHLLGLPFHVQIIEAAGGGVARVVAGAADAAREAERLLAESWRLVLPRRADTVVATLTGEPGFAEMARAAAAAAEVIQAGGRIVLLAGGAAAPGPEFDRLRGADSPDVAGLEGAARAWARAAAHAKLSVLSGHDDATLEGLFAARIGTAEQVQRLVARSGDCAVIEDAGHFLAVVE